MIEPWPHQAVPNQSKSEEGHSEINKDNFPIFYVKYDIIMSIKGEILAGYSNC
jgi:hypothetical protein